jgi:hypothetical protein
MLLRQGDRVRIRRTPSEYTGCRGTIADPDPEPDAEGAGISILGRLVAIDGENGVVRPFLVGELERLRPAKVGARTTVAEERAAHSTGAPAGLRTPPDGSGAD